MDQDLSVLSTETLLEALRARFDCMVFAGMRALSEGEMSWVMKAYGDDFRVIGLTSELLRSVRQDLSRNSHGDPEATPS